MIFRCRPGRRVRRRGRPPGSLNRRLGDDKVQAIDSVPTLLRTTARRTVRPAFTGPNVSWRVDSASLETVTGFPATVMSPALTVSDWPMSSRAVISTVYVASSAAGFGGASQVAA